MRVCVWCITVCRCVCVCVYTNICKCARVQYKRFTRVRASRICAAERWRCFIVYLCASVYECVHTDTCICEFIFCSSCLQELCIWRRFNFPAVWCKLNWEVNKQECNNSGWVVVCLLEAFFFWVFVSLWILAIINTKSNSQLSWIVGLGKDYDNSVYGYWSPCLQAHTVDINHAFNCQD